MVAQGSRFTCFLMKSTSKKHVFRSLENGSEEVKLDGTHLMEYSEYKEKKTNRIIFGDLKDYALKYISGHLRGNIEMRSVAYSQGQNLNASANIDEAAEIEKMTRAN